MSEYIYTSNGEPLANGCGEIALARHEIVRCKDCRYCMNYWKCDYCDYFKKVVNDPDGFCAWGEKKVSS